MVGDTIPKLAVLIDADNARSSVVDGLLSEIAKYGTAHAKRAHGDWTRPNLQGWKDELLRQSIQPIQQFAYTQGKNATDSAMIIDAMDLLYSCRYDGFCLVSSDSDFTRLAARIRESGLIVYGFGENHTPKPFVAACSKFVYTENLVHLDKLVPHAGSVAVPENHSSASQAHRDDQLANRLRTAVEAASDDDGWAKLSQVGHLLTKKHPDFDSRTYGYHKLSDLITDSSLFETARRSFRKGSPAEITVRDKRRKPSSSAN
ncbi:NYN domain-containing protein [Aspergillus pseudotamarii]|uniref:NYN domain-containing protein n=1 Tax=Aspergillus pseudotamarii TaxID=132259 RepID=A0A5N6SSY2_ASPPS|nr:NYN domain-containing protein [Aspergillus pseudotamarii]KAE8137796.1 NYN domain-containing protein [Aspergillus pseudotamarii]